MLHSGKLIHCVAMNVLTAGSENVRINNAHVKEIIINQSMHTTIHVQQFIEQVNFCCNHPYNTDH